MRVLSAIYLAPLSVLCTSCFLHHDEKPCNPRVAFGEEYEVTVVAPYVDTAGLLAHDPINPYGASAPSCASDDIKPGDTFRVRIEGRSQEIGECVDPLCPADLPTPSEPYSGPKSWGSATYFCSSAARKVKKSETCEAVRFIGLSDYGAAHLDKSTDGGPGSVPAAFLTRGLEVPLGSGPTLRCDAPEQSFPEGSADATKPGYFRCSDNFVVNVRKL